MAMARKLERFKFGTKEAEASFESFKKRHPEVAEFIEVMAPEEGYGWSSVELVKLFMFGFDIGYNMRMEE